MSAELHMSCFGTRSTSSSLVLSPPPSQCLPGLKRDSKVMQQKNILPLKAETSTKSLSELLRSYKQATTITAFYSVWIVDNDGSGGSTANCFSDCKLINRMYVKVGWYWQSVDLFLAAG